MDRLITAIILAAIPAIYLVVVRILTSRRRELSLFKKHPTGYYLDWMFVPFNLLIAYAINLNFLVLVPLLLASFIVNWAVLHWHWLKIHVKEKRKCFIFNLKSEKLTPAGRVHAAWQTIESTLVVYFLVFAAGSIFTYLALGVLFLFVLLSIPSSKKIHEKPLPSDLTYIILTSVIILLKLVLISL